MVAERCICLPMACHLRMQAAGCSCVRLLVGPSVQPAAVPAVSPRERAPHTVIGSTHGRAGMQVSSRATLTWDWAACQRSPAVKQALDADPNFVQAPPCPLSSTEFEKAAKLFVAAPFKCGEGSLVCLPSSGCVRLLVQCCWQPHVHAHNTHESTCRVRTCPQQMALDACSARPAGAPHGTRTQTSWQA